jgi:hypothetical protein
MPSINKLLVNIDQNLSQDEKKQALANLGITTASGDVGKSLTVQDEQGTLSWSENPGTFVAIYDEVNSAYSTFDEIDDAYNLGKDLIASGLISEGLFSYSVIAPVSKRVDSQGHKYYQFCSFTDGSFSRFTLDQETGWDYKKVPGLDFPDSQQNPYGKLGSSGSHLSSVYADHLYGAFKGDLTGDVTGDVSGNLTGDFNGRWLNASGTGDHYTPIFITGVGGQGQIIGVPAKCSAKFVYSVDVNGERIDKQYKLCMDGGIGTASGVIYCL